MSEQIKYCHTHRYQNRNIIVLLHCLYVQSDLTISNSDIKKYPLSKNTVWYLSVLLFQINSCYPKLPKSYGNFLGPEILLWDINNKIRLWDIASWLYFKRKLLPSFQYKKIHLNHLNHPPPRLSELFSSRKTF